EQIEEGLDALDRLALEVVLIEVGRVEPLEEGAQPADGPEVGPLTGAQRHDLPAFEAGHADLALLHVDAALRAGLDRQPGADDLDFRVRRHEEERLPGGLLRDVRGDQAAAERQTLPRRALPRQLLVEPGFAADFDAR